MNVLQNVLINTTYYYQVNLILLSAMNFPSVTLFISAIEFIIARKILISHFRVLLAIMNALL